MFLAMCPGPSLSFEELFDFLLFVASCGSLFVLALIGFVKWVEGRSEESAAGASLGLND